AAQDLVPTVGANKRVFVCDLAPSVNEQDLDLRQLFGLYGTVVVLQQADAEPERSWLVEYTAPEAAADAKGTISGAMVRGRMARAMLGSTLEIGGTMVSGRRLVIENLDTKIESQGFDDLCALFGEVLDSKLELDAGGLSKGYGFAHFATDEDAARAKETLEDMTIGESAVRVRPFTWDDASRFTGTAYARMIYNPYSSTGMGAM
ncbi:unnamed protein product, partial [Prorocentrum cordatum]